MAESPNVQPLVTTVFHGSISFVIWRHLPQTIPSLSFLTRIITGTKARGLLVASLLPPCTVASISSLSSTLSLAMSVLVFYVRLGIGDYHGLCPLNPVADSLRHTVSRLSVIDTRGQLAFSRRMLRQKLLTSSRYTGDSVDRSNSVSTHSTPYWSTLTA